MVPILLALALAPVPVAPSPGPMPPAVTKLIKPLPLSASVAEYVRWSLGEMGQAVVVVEGEAGLPLPRIPIPIRIFNVELNVLKPKYTMPTDIPMAPWMDPSIVRYGGNVVQKSYPLGWGY